MTAKQWVEGPGWWHPKGQRMALVPLSGRGKGVQLQNSESATVRITLGKRQGWFWLKYTVYHHEARTEGRIHVTSDELAGMFGVRLRVEENGGGRWYVRKGNFLNIPRPGNGRDGDPNMSVLITPEIQLAVKKLIA
tara:strand:- start:5487 stop:5894 length:408 start_codon:yes stop_codon:yes gene_type:complete